MIVPGALRHPLLPQALYGKGLALARFDLAERVEAPPHVKGLKFVAALQYLARRLLREREVGSVTNIGLEFLRIAVAVKLVQDEADPADPAEECRKARGTVAGALGFDRPHPGQIIRLERAPVFELCPGQRRPFLPLLVAKGSLLRNELVPAQRL